MHNSEDLLEFSKGEEKQMEEIIKGLHEAGINCVISGGHVSELALHYLNQYSIMVLRILSKFELKRVCQALNATALAKLTKPVLEELGTCESIKQTEIGDN